MRNPNSTRPWQHVLEAVSGYLRFATYLNKNKKLHGEIFNFGPIESKKLQSFICSKINEKILEQSVLENSEKK